MRRSAPPLGIAVVVSLAGMAIHNVVEFGARGLWAFEAALIPWALLQGILLLVWWRQPAARRAAAMALFATAIVQLVGGAIISVLPLPFLPFDPAQNVTHYAVHAVLGVAQVPLLVASWRAMDRSSAGAP